EQCIDLEHTVDEVDPYGTVRYQPRHLWNPIGQLNFGPSVSQPRDIPGFGDAPGRVIRGSRRSRQHFFRTRESAPDPAGLTVSPPAEAPLISLQQRPLDAEREQSRCHAKRSKRWRPGREHGKLSWQSHPHTWPHQERHFVQILFFPPAEADAR